ncbi:MAG: ATPase, T2SS/T4P/T4SS family [Acidimicrobiia bacterium]
MNDVDRIVASIIGSDVPLERVAVTRAAATVKPDEAPIAPHRVVHDAVDELVGLGPLERLLRDPTVSDVLVNGPAEIWVERSGALELTDVVFSGADAIVGAVRRVIAPLGLRLDRAVPAVDARLPDGSRLHAIIPPAAVDGPIVAVRRFLHTVVDMEGFVAIGGIDPDGAELLEAAVRSRENILVAGSTGAGKTTLLNVLCAAITTGDRIVTIEDAAELDIAGHVVRLEAHPPNVEGKGEVTIRSLLAHALRLRPDRLIVGEVRGPEALDMVQALNTGHAGSMSTVHANGSAEALARLESLASMVTSNLSVSTLHAQIRSAFDLVVFVERADTGRRVGSVHRVEPTTLTEIYPC